MLSKEQQQGFIEVLDFINNPDQQFMNISGGAGSGKSFFIAQVANGILRHKDENCSINKIAVTATTNKATAVISETMLNFDTNISTIYSFMNLRVSENFSTGEVKIVPTNRFVVHQNTLIIIDECSMIDSNLLKYLRMGISQTCKILFVGDKNQLAPIKEPLSPIYKASHRSFELTKPIRNADQPALMDLCEQAKQTVLTGVFTPIIPVPGVIDFVDGAQLKDVLEREYYTEDSQKRVISYTNKRVVEYNTFIRNVRGYTQPYVVGEILFNNEPCELSKTVRLYTDQMVEVTQVGNTFDDPHIINGYELEVMEIWVRDLMTQTEYPIVVFANIQDRRDVLKHYANHKQWDLYFAVKNRYPDLRPVAASTAHKAQGSTYDSVVVDVGDISRCTTKDQTARLLYVALSRPRKHLYIRGVLSERYFQ